jgi:hypothetical protein
MTKLIYTYQVNGCADNKKTQLEMIVKILIVPSFHQCVARLDYQKCNYQFSLLLLVPFFVLLVLEAKSNVSGSTWLIQVNEYADNNITPLEIIDKILIVPSFHLCVARLDYQNFNYEFSQLLYFPFFVFLV